MEESSTYASRKISKRSKSTSGVLRNTEFCNLFNKKNKKKIIIKTKVGKIQHIVENKKLKNNKNIFAKYNIAKIQDCINNDIEIDPEEQNQFSKFLGLEHIGPRFKKNGDLIKRTFLGGKKTFENEIDR